MGDIRDLSQAASGQKKIDWVQSYMPVLTEIRSEFLKDKPFSGLRITMSIHLEAKTANLATVLRDGGADVVVTGCNPLSTQDDVAAALAAEGFEVFARHGVTNEEYSAHLKQALMHSPHLIIDDGGDLIELLEGELRDCGRDLLGGCEETTTGIHRLKSRNAAGKLSYTMLAINDAECKFLFDNRYGTGQSVFDGVMHTTNNMISAKTLVVAGFGWCGRGIALRAKGLGANVVVTEVNPVRALEAAMEGYRVLPMDEAAKIGDIFITATGCKDVIVKRHFESMKDGVLLANAGHFDVEVSKPDLRALATNVAERKPGVVGYTMKDGRILNLLADGRLVNLAAGNGHPAEIMDMSFAIQSLCLRYLAEKGSTLTPGVYDVPADIDGRVATMKLRAMHLAIDALTDDQKAYIGAF